MRADLKFLQNLPVYDVEKPFTLYGFPDTVKPQTNCEYEWKTELDVTDVRDQFESFKLRECGFEFRKMPSNINLKAETFEDPAHREAVWAYLIETIQNIKELLQAEKVLCFDWRFRRAGASCNIHEQLGDLQNARYHALSPASLMHCDYAFEGGLDTLQIHLSDEEQNHLKDPKKEILIVNVWRPLSPVRNAPLIMCDRRTVKPEHIMDVDQVAPNKVEKSMTLMYNEGQRFYGLSEQTADEVSLFISWQSNQNKTCANHTPHGACMRPVQGQFPPRESVEVRLIVILDKH